MQKPSKLHRKISVLILVGTVAAVAVIGISTYFFSKSSLSESIKRNQLEIARQTMSQIDRMLYERYMDIQAIAGEDQFKEILSNIKEQIDSDVTNVKEINERMRELRIQTGPWDQLSVMDLSGNVVLSTSREIRAIHEDPVAMTAYEKGKAGDVYYSDVVTPLNTTRPTIIFSAPVMIAKEGKQELIGVVIGNFSWRAVSQILEDVPFHTMLMNQGKMVIAYNMNKSESVLKKHMLTSFAQQAGYLSYKGSGWGLILETPAAVALQSATRTTLKLVFLLIMIVVMGSWILWITITRAITDPIANLTATIHAIIAGDMSQKAHISSNDEIGELADSFNIMTANLKKSHTSLEEKVKKRTVELEDAKEWLSTTLRSIGDAVIATDAHGHVSFMNPIAEIMTGWKQEEARGRPLKEVFHIINEETREEVNSPVERVLREGIIVGLANHTILISKDGKEVPLNDSGAPIREKSGAIVGVVLVFQDITERKNTERAIEEDRKKIQAANQDLATGDKILRATIEELKSAQSQLVQSDRLAAIGQLAAGVAHEINNPVGFINSNLSTLSRYVSSFSDVFRAVEKLKAILLNEKNLQKAIKYAEEIEELEKDLKMDVILSDVDSLLRESQGGIDRIIKIVGDLKTFARADKGEIVPENLNQILDSVSNIVWNEIKYKAELKKEYGEIPAVKCSGQQIGQVVMNMLVNAAQAIEKKGIITIRTVKKDSWVCIEISDTGAGIPKDIIDKIYNPFFTTKEVGKGTGLGLSISYDIIKKHQGKIDIESEVGKGTKFIISLPA